MQPNPLSNQSPLFLFPEWSSLIPCNKINRSMASHPVSQTFTHHTIMTIPVYYNAFSSAQAKISGIFFIAPTNTNSLLSRMGYRWPLLLCLMVFAVWWMTDSDPKNRCLCWCCSLSVPNYASKSKATAIISILSIFERSYWRRPVLSAPWW